MNQQEFESRIGKQVSQEEWEVAEMIYTFHPEVPDVNGKDVFAKIWAKADPDRIAGMYARAKAIANLEDERQSKVMELERDLRTMTEEQDRITEQIDQLKLELDCLTKTKAGYKRDHEKWLASWSARVEVVSRALVVPAEMQK